MFLRPTKEDDRNSVEVGFAVSHFWSNGRNRRPLEYVFLRMHISQNMTPAHLSSPGFIQVLRHFRLVVDGCHWFPFGSLLIYQRTWFLHLLGPKLQVDGFDDAAIEAAQLRRWFEGRLLTAIGLDL